MSDDGVEANVDNGERAAAVPVADTDNDAAVVVEPQELGNNALNLAWSFGFNKDAPLGVHNLSNGDKLKLFYTASHTGLIYNMVTHEQKLLQGHCNSITSTCVSADKLWVVTGDRGPNNMVIVWDANTGEPVRTLFDPFKDGVLHMDMSSDSMYLVFLSTSTPQTIAIWDWTDETREIPLYSHTINDYNDLQTCVRFSQVDSKQLVSNGEQRVMFFSWRPMSSAELKKSPGVSMPMEYYSPSLTPKDFRKAVAPFIQSCFVSQTGQAITSTKDGEIVVWDSAWYEQDPTGATVPQKKAIKRVRLHHSSITFLSCIDHYVVTGGADGHVRFFDLQFRVIHWFEHLNSGPIKSISFAWSTPRLVTPETFSCYDFIVSTSSAVIMHFSGPNTSEPSTEKRIYRIMEGQNGAIYGLSTHPTLPHFAVCGLSGCLQVWDYNVRRMVNQLQFPSGLHGYALEYDPTGSFIAVGFSNGALEILNSTTLKDLEHKAMFNVARDCITYIVFSHDSTMLATADADHCVSIFKTDEEKDNAWIYIGKYRAHSKPIMGLLFRKNLDTGLPNLLSISQDRTLVEYDLIGSSIAKGVRLLSCDRIEQTAHPMAMAVYPRLEKEEFIMTTNDELKLKLFNTQTSMCRRTVLGPIFGGPVVNLKVIPHENDVECGKYLAYSTMNNVVGLIALPLDGNPYKNMAVIAHAGRVSNMTSSHDGNFLLTAGGPDCTVNLWRIQSSCLDTQIRLGGTQLEPFMGLIEGGRTGPLFRELTDYFYYAQIRAQGEDSRKARVVSNKIPLTEVPNVVRALGFYPSEQVVEDMTNEIKFSDFIQSSQYETEIGLEGLVKLFLNHRPVFGISREQIDISLSALVNHVGSQDGSIKREQLLNILQRYGELLTEEQLSEHLGMLLGDTDGDLSSLPSIINTDNLSKDILGFVEAPPPAAAAAD